MPIEQLKGEIERVLREMGVEQTPDIVLERPRNAEHGDFASNVAMTLAKPLHRPPRQIAEELVRRIDVARTLCQTAVRECGFKYSDPWVAQATLEDTCTRKTERDMGAVFMFWGSCPGDTNCQMDWANTHAEGMW